jgi:5-bromo-4-chloroindolyl phosphate hydrolysis protein
MIIKKKKNPSLIETYHEKGLSDQDITIFRQTMQDAKAQIKVGKQQLSMILSYKSSKM